MRRSLTCKLLAALLAAAVLGGCGADPYRPEAKNDEMVVWIGE